ANASGERQGLLLVPGVLLSYVFVFAFMLDGNPYRNSMLSWFAVLLGGPFLMLALPYVVALPVVFVYYFARALKHALAAEFAALERADQGGGTVLGRLAAGFGKKS